MIKMNSKKILAVLLVLGLFFSVKVLAENAGQGNASSHAQNIEDKKADKQAKITENLCEKISNLAEKFSAKIAQQEEEIRNRQEERLNSWEEKSAQVESELDSRRETWDENRDQQFTKLEERAQTEVQEKAVTDFEATVRAAIATRRATIDTAMKIFRDGVQAAVRTRQGQIDQLVSDSKASRQAAIDKAQEACDNGSDPATVRTTLRTSLQAAKGDIQSDKQDVAKVGATVEALVRIRQQAVEKAKGDFKAVMEQARIQLKKAFPTEIEAE